MDNDELNRARVRYCRRAQWHDYQAPHFYHIIIYKKAEADYLSDIPDEPYGLKPHEVSFRKNGLAFIEAVAEFRRRFEFFKLSHYVVMPDHVHFIIEARERLPYHLGHYLRILMYAARRYAGCKVFEDKYTDKILSNRGQLHNWVHYIHDNPRRLQIRRRCRGLFQRCCEIGIRDPKSGVVRRFSCFGNIFLLKSPERLQVRYSKGYSAEEMEAHREACLRVASQQGVLVSPYIHNAEREIRRECLDAGASVIHLYNESLSPRFKPSGGDFDLCAAGRLLIIAPAEFALSKPLSRQACMTLNSIAAFIATVPSSADMAIRNIAQMAT